MIELQDRDGRLVVVLQTERTQYCVFINGEYKAEFRSGRDALAYAKSLAAQQDDQPVE
jgi:hypothetical protein